MLLVMLLYTSSVMINVNHEIGTMLFMYQNSHNAQGSLFERFSHFEWALIAFKSRIKFKMLTLE